MDLNSDMLIRFIAENLENNSTYNNLISEIKIDKPETDFDYTFLNIYTKSNEKFHILAFKVQ